MGASNGTGSDAMKLLFIALMLLSILACGPHWQDTPRPHYHNQMPYIPAK